MVDRKNKPESIGFMYKYYVVEVIVVPYQRFKVINNIVFKEAYSYYVTIGDIPQCTCPNFIKLSSMTLGRNERKWVNCKHLYYMFTFLCKVDWDNDKFMHTPTYKYNEIL